MASKKKTDEQSDEQTEDEIFQFDDDDIENPEEGDAAEAAAGDATSDPSQEEAVAQQIIEDIREGRHDGGDSIVGDDALSGDTPDTGQSGEFSREYAAKNPETLIRPTASEAGEERAEINNEIAADTPLADDGSGTAGVVRGTMSVNEQTLELVQRAAEEPADQTDEVRAEFHHRNQESLSREPSSGIEEPLLRPSVVSGDQSDEIGEAYAARNPDSRTRPGITESLHEDLADNVLEIEPEENSAGERYDVPGRWATAPLNLIVGQILSFRSAKLGGTRRLSNEDAARQYYGYLQKTSADGMPENEVLSYRDFIREKYSAPRKEEPAVTKNV